MKSFTHVSSNQQPRDAHIFLLNESIKVASVIINRITFKDISNMPLKISLVTCNCNLVGAAVVCRFIANWQALLKF